MCNAELFVYFAFLVSVGVVACVMRLTCCTVTTPFLPYLLPVLLVPLSVYRATTLPFSRPSVAPLQ